ncbi:hypothetical protein N2152v2_003610 [Parachlorella kessleri]
MSKVLGPLLVEGRSRQDGAAPQPLETLSADLHFNLPNGKPVDLQLDSPKYKGNLGKFQELLSQLQEAAPECDTEQFASVQCLLASQAARANLVALWQLFRRAIYASQVSGTLLPPLLLDGLRSHLAAYTAQAQGLLAAAGALCGLAVLGVVEPAMEQLVAACERREREVAGKDEALAAALSRLGHDLRSMQAMALRFMEDRRYSSSRLLVPHNMAALHDVLREQQLGDDLEGTLLGTDSLEALVWKLVEGPQDVLEAWIDALLAALEGRAARDEGGLLFAAADGSLGGAGRQQALQSRDFRQAQQVALEVLVMAATTLELTERLHSCLPSGARGTPDCGSTLSSTLGDSICGTFAAVGGAPSTTTSCDSPTSCLSGASSPPAPRRQAQRLLAVASACRSLLTGPVQQQALQGSRSNGGGGGLGGSALVPGLLAGYGVALQLAEDIERREGALRVRDAEARAALTEQLCRELQFQVLAQRRAQRDILRAQQQLTAAWFTVLEAQVGLSAAQRSVLKDAHRQLQQATHLLTAPQVAADPSQQLLLLLDPPPPPTTTTITSTTCTTSTSTLGDSLGPTAPDATASTAAAAAACCAVVTTACGGAADTGAAEAGVGVQVHLLASAGVAPGVEVSAVGAGQAPGGTGAPSQAGWHDEVFATAWSGL